MHDFRDYVCPGCRKTLTIPGRYGGRLMKCPFCTRLQRTPGPAEPLPAVPRPRSVRRPSPTRRAPQPVLAVAVLVCGVALVVGAVVGRTLSVNRPAPHALNGPGARPAAARTADAERQAEDDLRTWRHKVEEWRTRQWAAREVLARLEGDERQMVDSLAGLGVKTAADLKGNRKAQVYAEELQEIVRQRVAARQQVAEWDEAVVRLESAIRRTERARQLDRAGITDAERADLFRLMLELDGRVETLSGNVAVPEPNLDALLNDRLKTGR
jgi:hypothetical protein